MGLCTGKVALVTGAGAGIGRAAAQKFAQEGAKVVVSDIVKDGGAKTVELIKAAGGEAHFIHADVTRSKDVKNLISKTVKTYGALHCACNNAGIEGVVAPFVEQSDDNFDEIISVNVRGVFLCMKAEIEHMRENGGGTIVNLASIAGLIGFPNLAAYSASKHAVNGLTKNGALEYAQENIRVNSVCPGGIDTRMLDSVAEQSTSGEQSSREMMAPLHPMGRIGIPKEVADLIVWLSSEQSSFITGAHIPVDGGYVAQ
jgi:NAD(P)-dependent dehydrogenase (short-subunit alcohol dehydrogenase family)